jgi:RHS repeat-associated protein
LQEKRFAGLQHRDTNTNLDPTRFRMMSSTQGRWFSPDRFRGNVAKPQSLNRYAYVMNNPLSFTDPTGLVNWWQVGRGGVDLGLGVLEMGAGISLGAASGGFLSAVGAYTALNGTGRAMGGFMNVVGGLTEDPNAANAAKVINTVANPAGLVFTPSRAET